MPRNSHHDSIGHITRYLVAAHPLSAIKRHVCSVQQQITSLTIVGIECKADRYRERVIDFPVHCQSESSNRMPEAFGPLFCYLRRNVREQNHELFPSIPARYILIANIGPEDLRDSLQRQISGRMTKGVVEFLEMIQIQHENRQRLLMPRRPGNLPLERNLHEPAIEQTSKRIPYRLIFQGGLQIQGRNCHSRQLHELPQAIGALAYRVHDLRRWALHIEHAQRISMRHHWHTQILLRRISKEVR